MRRLLIPLAGLAGWVILVKLVELGVRVAVLLYEAPAG
jgi:hypothetical protein